MEKDAESIGGCKGIAGSRVSRRCHNVDLEMEAEVAGRMVRDAQRFVERMREYLVSKGVTLEEGRR